MVDKDGKYSYSNTIKIEIGKVQDFSILSNPVKDHLIITGIKKGSTLALYNNAGKMLLQKNVHDRSVLINISFLSSGVYYLTYFNKGLIETKKIMKQ